MINWLGARNCQPGREVFDCQLEEYRKQLPAFACVDESTGWGHKSSTLTGTRINAQLPIATFPLLIPASPLATPSLVGILQEPCLEPCGAPAGSEVGTIRHGSKSWGQAEDLGENNTPKDTSKDKSLLLGKSLEAQPC